MSRRRAGDTCREQDAGRDAEYFRFPVHVPHSKLAPAPDAQFPQG
jgi:hypothetical protein